jgi:hypothetical protein
MSEKNSYQRKFKRKNRDIKRQKIEYENGCTGETVSGKKFAAIRIQ